MAVWAGVGWGGRRMAPFTHAPPPTAAAQAPPVGSGLAQAWAAGMPRDSAAASLESAAPGSAAAAAAAATAATATNAAAAAAATAEPGDDGKETDADVPVRCIPNVAAGASESSEGRGGLLVPALGVSLTRKVELDGAGPVSQGKRGRWRRE